jgi:predicted ATPase with chaperone activity
MVTMMAPREALIFCPERKPRTLDELGVRQSVLDDLALKVLYLSGPMTTRELSRHISLGSEVTHELFTRMRTDLLCQVTGMHGNFPEIAITSQGRNRAMDLLAQNPYAAAAPVSLESYINQVRRQRVRNRGIYEADIEKAFARLVLDARILEQVGTALNSGAAIFLHGPSGVGKTAIAETISELLASEDIWIPWAVEVDGQIISVFDSLVHQATDPPSGDAYDERWVRCRRPSVTVGGELSVEMLDLQLNAGSRLYVAPVQMKANNGVLIIDDFGRQRSRPEELLNRWIVPLDRGIDFLSLAGGKKIEIPFEVLVVFATNMDPADLVDGAFLRRIQTKIKVDAASDEQFSEIFRRVARECRLVLDPALLDEVIHDIRGRLHQGLAGCQPRDLINQVCWMARYRKQEPRLDRASLCKAVDAYFMPRA